MMCWKRKKARPGALAKLDTIKDEVVPRGLFRARHAAVLLADGEVVMGSTYNGRLFSLIEEQDQPVAMLLDGQVFDLDGWISRPQVCRKIILASVKRGFR